MLDSNHPDFDPLLPEALAPLIDELAALVERMIAAQPQQQAKILAAARRLRNAFAPPGQTRPANARRAEGAVGRDLELLEILLDKGINLHSPKAADTLYEEMTRRWEQSGHKRRRLARDTIRGKLWQMRKQSLQMVTPDPDR